MTPAKELQTKGMNNKDLALFIVNAAKNRKLTLEEIKIVTDFIEGWSPIIGTIESTT